MPSYRDGHRVRPGVLLAVGLLVALTKYVFEEGSSRSRSAARHRCRDVWLRAPWECCSGSRDRRAHHLITLRRYLRVDRPPGPRGHARRGPSVPHPRERVPIVIMGRPDRASALTPAAGPPSGRPSCAGLPRHDSAPAVRPRTTPARRSAGDAQSTDQDQLHETGRPSRPPTPRCRAPKTAAAAVGPTVLEKARKRRRRRRPANPLTPRSSRRTRQREEPRTSRLTTQGRKQRTRVPIAAQIYRTGLRPADMAREHDPPLADGSRSSTRSWRAEPYLDRSRPNIQPHRIEDHLSALLADSARK